MKRRNELKCVHRKRASDYIHAVFFAANQIIRHLWERERERERDTHTHTHRELDARVTYPQVVLKRHRLNSRLQ